MSQYHSNLLVMLDEELNSVTVKNSILYLCFIIALLTESMQVWMSAPLSISCDTLP